MLFYTHMRRSACLENQQSKSWPLSGLKHRPLVHVGNMSFLDTDHSIFPFELFGLNHFIRSKAMKSQRRNRLLRMKEYRMKGKWEKGE